MKRWFWNSYEKVKNLEARKLPFLDLTKATFKYVLQANGNQLSNAIENLNGKPQVSKEDKVVEVLNLIFKKFSSIPETKRFNVPTSYRPYIWWTPFFQ